MSLPVARNRGEDSPLLPFLGTWDVGRTEVRLFGSPLGALEALVLPEGTSQREEKIPASRIRGGINGNTSTSELCAGLESKASFFTATLSGPCGERYLTFIPRLQGAAVDGDSEEKSGATPESALQKREIQEKIGLIQAKLANVIADPRYVGIDEFHLALKVGDRLQDNLFPLIPWEEFTRACLYLVRDKIEENELATAFHCAREFVAFFLRKRSFLNEEKQGPTSRGVLQLLAAIRAFLQEAFLQEKREYLALALTVADHPESQLELLLEGGALSLALAERKKEAEKKPLQEPREYQKTASFKEYETATTYFVSAYRLAELHPELSSQKMDVFTQLCAVQGSLLKDLIPDVNDRQAFMSYVDSYAEKCSPLCLKQLKPPEIALLVKERENAAEYLEACGYFKLAYRLYKVLYDQFEKVEGVDVEKYLHLTTKLGTSEQGARAREHFLKKIEDLRKRLEEIRKHAEEHLASGKGASLESQKDLDSAYRAFTRDLFETCNLILDPLGSHPYALLAVGSLARQEMCPYSDFELALLVEKEADLAHFRKVAELFHLLILSLGETKEHNVIARWSL